MTLKFQAQIENGAITVPEELKQELVDGIVVQVLVLKQPAKKISTTGILAQLAQEPLQVEGVRAMTREEIHERQ
jgi:hypothetical protein